MSELGSKEYVDASTDSKPYHAVQQEIQEATPDCVPGGGGFTCWDHHKCRKHQEDNGHHGRFLRRSQELDVVSRDKWRRELIDMMPEIKGARAEAEALVKEILCDLTEICLPLVGKFECHHVSEDRPEKFQCSPYALRGHRGEDVRSFGSGYIYYIKGPFTDGNSGDIFWEVSVATARHVIYDQAEANVAKFLLEDEFGKEDTISLGYGEIKKSDTKKTFVTLNIPQKTDPLLREFSKHWTFEKRK